MLNIVLAIMLSQTTVVKSYTGKFLSCYDGDTCYFDVTWSVRAGLNLELSAKALGQEFRLCDINAPEIKPLETREAGTKARDALVSWITTAKVVRIDIPQKHNCDVAGGTCDKSEKYGRWLAYLYADGVNLNKKLVELGLAVPFMSCQ